MRANEFISEATRGKISKRQQKSTRGLNKFADADGLNSDYMQYRLGLALAVCDGITEPDVDLESWVGRWKTAHPYTQEEQDMLNLSYKAVGMKHQDVNKGDMRSQELDSTYTLSPVPNRKKLKK